MAIKNKNTIGILSIASFFVFAAGIGMMYIEQSVSLVAIFLVFFGIVGLIGYLFAINYHFAQLRKKVQLARVLLLTGLTVGFIVVFFCANYFAYKSNLRWDLTLNKQHTLADVTVDIIEGLDTPLKMTAFVVGAPPKYLDDLLNEYERNANGLITVNVIDPLVDLSYAAQFGSVISGNEKKLIVQAMGDRVIREDIDFTKEPLGEEHINNAITRVLRPAQNVYFLEGHNEYKLDDEGDTGLSTLDQILDNNNIQTHSLILGEGGQVPEDCDLLVIAGPKQHLSEDEELIIHEFMKTGGDVLFLIENVIVSTEDKPLTEEEEDLNPNLNRILNKWGLKVYNDVVVDTKSFVGQDVGSPATKNYLTHRAIVSNLDFTFYIRPRSVSTTQHKRESIKLAPLVLTASPQKSWGESNRYLKVKYDEYYDRKGPVSIAYVGWEPRNETKDSDTRFLVYTDADFLTNVYIDQFSNAQMGLNAITWLMELDYQVYPETKKLEIEPLELTSTERRIIIAILIFIPFMILFLGFSVWLQTTATRS